MTTQQTDAVISDDAVELLSRFYNGVDKVVYAIAEGVARRRSPAADPIRISLADVEAAGKIIARALERASESDDIRQVVTDEMISRFTTARGIPK